MVRILIIASNILKTSGPLPYRIMIKIVFFKDILYIVNKYYINIDVFLKIYYKYDELKEDISLCQVIFL